MDKEAPKSVLIVGVDAFRHPLVYAECQQKIEAIKKSPRSCLPYEPTAFSGRVTIERICLPEEDLPPEPKMPPKLWLKNSSATVEYANPSEST